MRLKFHAAMVALTLAGLSLLSIPPARAQEQTEVLMPEQSAAKAKDLIQKAVQALGGSDYLAVRDATCSGRIGSFGHSGDLMGYEKFIDYSKLPDKDRSENLPKRNIIEIKNGDKGWVLDRGGVSEADEVSIAEFQEDIKTDIDNVLRDRWKEPGTILRYLGPDVVDLKEADWIEFVDNENRSIRIAFAKVDSPAAAQSPRHSRPRHPHAQRNHRILFQLSSHRRRNTAVPGHSRAQRAEDLPGLHRRM